MQPGIAASRSCFSILPRKEQESSADLIELEKIVLQDDVLLLSRLNARLRSILQKSPRLLFFAVRHGKWNAATFLQISMRLYPLNVQDVDGWTVLHHCAIRRAKSPVLALLSHCASVSVVDHYGRTALHLAALYGDLAMVRLLVEAGSNTTARARDGRTALELAIDNKHHEVAQFLRGK